MIFRRNAAWIVLLFFWALPAAVEGQAKKSSSDERVKAELIRLTRELSRASVEKDAATLGRLMDDEFLLVGVTGKFFDKKTLIAFWTKKPDDPATVETSEPADFEVRLFGDTAIVVSTITDTEKSGAGTTIVRTRAFDVWKKGKKGWRWIASRESLLPADEKK
ncbi:MAG: nuclear transport factor 2 family protein [Acidobacteria bacterium]|nr:nuclear transport factor 2 family protein [Acidobacteriota bacterium]